MHDVRQACAEEESKLGRYGEARPSAWHKISPSTRKVHRCRIRIYESLSEYRNALKTPYGSSRRAAGGLPSPPRTSAAVPAQIREQLGFAYGNQVGTKRRVTSPTGVLHDRAHVVSRRQRSGNPRLQAGGSSQARTIPWIDSKACVDRPPGCRRRTPSYED